MEVHIVLRGFLCTELNQHPTPQFSLFQSQKKEELRVSEHWDPVAVAGYEDSWGQMEESGANMDLRCSKFSSAGDIKTKGKMTKPE